MFWGLKYISYLMARFTALPRLRARFRSKVKDAGKGEMVE